MTEPFYITTPIYYVNDVPHLGHAFCTIVADTLSRFHRMRGDDTRFLTGTDEHGQKVEEAAAKRGLTPQQLVDEVAPRFDACWKALGIENYHFIRTTSARHKRVVGSLWKKIRQHHPDDLYLASYQGWYCVGCEAFYTESQLTREGSDWLCSIHKTPVRWLDKERSWFFRLSNYAEPLLRHIEKHPDFIRPEQYRNEIVSFLKTGLKDLSVSRTSFAWGIPAPEPDPEGQSHVVYVWMDALTNYLTDLCPESGEIAGPDVERYWPHAIHLIGKDILRFHAVYWPAFLMSAGLPLPKGIFATGWWTVRGEKISKSMPATRIDPIKLSQLIGNDAMRYYLLREVPLGLDGDFTFESLFGRYNAELANDLGNLVSRCLALMAKSSLEPTRDPFLAEQPQHSSLEKLAAEVIPQAAKEFEAIQPSRALETIWKLVREANRYVDQSQPWVLARDPAKATELAHVFHELANAIGVIGGLIMPVLPATGRQLRAWVGLGDDTRWPDELSMHRVIGTVAKDAKALFPRLDDARQNEIVAAIVPQDSKPAPAPAPATPTITKDDFDKIEVRVGKILDAQAIPKKDKLLKLTVDLGEPEPRTILAGIAQQHKPETLVGKSTLFVANLEPRKLGGLVSQGMLLAAGDDAILTTVSGDVPPGTRVR